MIMQKQVPVGAPMAASYAAAAGSTSAVSAAPPRISNHADPPPTLVGTAAPGPSYVDAGSPVRPSPQAVVPTPVIAMTAGGGAPRATSAGQPTAPPPHPAAPPPQPPLQQQQQQQQQQSPAQAQAGGTIVTAPTPLPAMPIGVQQGASSVESQTGSAVVEPVPLLTVTAGGQTGAGIIMEPVPVSAQMAASYAAAAGSTNAVSAAPPTISNHADPPQTLVGISAPGPSYVGAGSPVMPSPQAMVPTPVVAMTAGGGAPRATSASQVQHSTVQANASQPRVVLPQMQTLQPTQAVVSTQQSLPNGQTGPTKVGGTIVTAPTPLPAMPIGVQQGASSVESQTGSPVVEPVPLLTVTAGR